MKHDLCPLFEWWFGPNTVTIIHDTGYMRVTVVIAIGRIQNGLPS